MKNKLNQNQPSFLQMLQGNAVQPRIKEMTYRHISIPLDGDIEDDLTLYRDCIEEIKDANQGDIVSLIINTRGGSLKTALAIINAIEQTEADTVAVIEGEAASAGSLIAMHCQNIELNPYSTLFIHSESFGSAGKRSEVKAQVEFNLDWVENIFRNSYHGFLTEEEMQQVLDGRDMYFNAEEILQRLQQRQEILEAEQDEEGCCNDCEDCSCQPDIPPPEYYPDVVDSPCCGENR